MTPNKSILTDGRPPSLPRSLASTPSGKRAQTAFTLTIRQKAIMLIDGPPGTGKTTASAQLILMAEESGVQAAYIAVPERPSPTELLHLTIEAISGMPASGTKHAMENEARAILADFGGLLVLDEVQNLKRTGMQELRYLHDDSQTSVAMLLSGWQADDVIRGQPDLNSRVRYRAAFQLLRPNEVASTVRQLGPILANADEEIINQVDEVYARGNLRQWTSFSRTAQELIGVTSELDWAAAEAVIALLDASVLARAS
jgi:DNA transposition AAA+ family ATPase